MPELSPLLALLGSESPRLRATRCNRKSKGLCRQVYSFGLFADRGDAFPPKAKMRLRKTARTANSTTKKTVMKLTNEGLAMRTTTSTNRKISDIRARTKRVRTRRSEELD